MGKQGFGDLTVLLTARDAVQLTCEGPAASRHKFRPPCRETRQHDSD